MNKNSLSVIAATFNGAQFIEKQIDSILNQTLLPDEIIICDDKSTDNTVSLLEKYSHGSLIRVYVNDNQLGVVNNFKRAARLVSAGNWVVFCDQDDIWKIDKLSKLVKEIKIDDDGVTPTLVFSDLSIINKNDELIFDSFWKKQKIKPQKIDLASLLYGNVVTGCTMIVNYPMIKEFLLMEDNGYLHDEWLSLIAYSFGRVKFIDEKLVLYRQHNNNVTFAENEKQASFIDNVKKNLNYLSGKKEFLNRQFNLAKSFLFKYQSRLTADQKRIIQNFINQQNKNYILKRFNRLKTFN